MRAVVQRVRAARVEVAEQVVGAIGLGVTVFVAAGREDDGSDLDYLVAKLVGLRLFEDDAGKMNLSLKEVSGAVLAISQFTLYGDVRRGRRPSFSAAMAPEPAAVLYEAFVSGVRARGLEVQTGRFGADMRVVVDNDGPVTLLLDSKRGF